MYTEDEAKTKWCPFAIQPSKMLTQIPTADPTISKDIHFFVASNRGYAMGQSYEGCRCIASECMAWRWQPPREHLDNQGNLRKQEPKTVGYCGLAGEPK